MRATNDFVGTASLHATSTLGGPNFKPVVASELWLFPNSEVHDDNTLSDKEVEPTNRHSGKIVMALKQSLFSHIVGTSDPSNSPRKVEGKWWTFGSSNNPDIHLLVLDVTVPESFIKSYSDYERELSNALLKAKGPIANEAYDFIWSTQRIPLQSGIEWSEDSPLTDETVCIPRVIQEELDVFATGIEGVGPTLGVVESAKRIARVAVESAAEPDLTVDVDGELSFYVRLSNGYLIMAEMSIEGSIDASIFDERDELMGRMPNANEKEFIEVLKS